MLAFSGYGGSSVNFDWEAFSQLSDEEKVAYMKKAEEEAREASKGKTFPPGSIAPEKARHQDGWEVVGRMKSDGTIHYYTDDEMPPRREGAGASDDGGENTEHDEDNEK